MTGTPEIHTLEAARERAEKALGLSLGMASPLWLAFGAAAGLGVAWWWMTRWGRAVNLEAMFAAPDAAEPKAAEQTTLAVVVPIAAAPAALEPAPVATIARPENASGRAPDAAAADDLTRMVGIGAKLAAALAERGVTRFEHIAAWTRKDIDHVDADLKLLGRATRDAWIAQAKRFAAEA